MKLYYFFFIIKNTQNHKTFFFLSTSFSRIKQKSYLLMRLAVSIDETVVLCFHLIVPIHLTSILTRFTLTKELAVFGNLWFQTEFNKNLLYLIFKRHNNKKRHSLYDEFNSINQWDCCLMFTFDWHSIGVKLITCCIRIHQIAKAWV